MQLSEFNFISKWTFSVKFIPNPRLLLEPIVVFISEPIAFLNGALLGGYWFEDKVMFGLSLISMILANANFLPEIFTLFITSRAKVRACRNCLNETLLCVDIMKMICKAVLFVAQGGLKHIGTIK